MNLREQTLGQLALDLAGASSVMRKYRLDYCCGGKQTLAQAAEAGQLDLGALEAELAALVKTDDKQEWSEAPLPELIDYILVRYHDKHRLDFPTVIEQAQKVERVHAAKPNVPAGLANVLQALNDELESHMMKEEQILFPMIKNGMGRNAAAPISVMEREHDDAGQLVEQILGLTQNLTPPPEACTTWKVLYQGVDQLIVELMDHINLENQILFPRALSGA